MTMSTEKEVKNGKQSSPPSLSSSNTNPITAVTGKQQVVTELTPATSDDDDFPESRKSLNKPKNGKSEFEEKIRVGKDYQVVVPELNPKVADSYPDKALLVWSPAKDIPEIKLEEYIELAKESYGYNAEQALGMLFWHKHDLQKAVLDLQNFTPFPDEWSSEDKVMFEQAYQFHGKCFHRIRQMLPDKSIASLVKFYYSWKKARTRSSTERHEKKKHHGGDGGNGSENGSDNGSPNDSDIEEKNDSDNDVKAMGEIEEIIGINNKDGVKTSNNKTSIMTPSGGKSLKRKHEDEGDVAETNEKEAEVGGKKLAPEMKIIDKPELTITLKSKEAEVA